MPVGMLFHTRKSGHCMRGGPLRGANALCGLCAGCCSVMHTPQGPAAAEAHSHRLPAHPGSGPPERAAGHRRLLTGSAASKGHAKASVFNIDHHLGPGM